MDPSDSLFGGEPYLGNPWGWSTATSDPMPTALRQVFPFHSGTEPEGLANRDWEAGLQRLQIHDMGIGEGIFPRTILDFKPEFKTLVPPLHFGIDEVHWMHPLRKTFHELLLDTSLEETPEDENKYQLECQVFNTAIDEPLPFALRQNLIRDIETNPNIANYFGLSTSNLPNLVKNNQQVAIAILLALMEQRDITDLLDILVEMELSVNTMEVVNRLANNLIPGSQGAALPRPFLHTYISNSIIYCGNISNPQLQNRQARLVCVFLQSLFRNNIIDIQLIPQALLFQIEAFCVEFGRVREATALFTYVKELETSDAPGDPAVAKDNEILEHDRETDVAVAVAETPAEPTSTVEA